MFDDETLQIYKVLVAAHQELVLYLYTAGAQAYESGTSVIKPLDSTWQYTLGNSIFVSPITTNETKRLVSFPKGNDWMDFWNNSAIYKGGSQVTYKASLNIIPVFIQTGSIIPLLVTTNDIHRGAIIVPNAITIMITSPQFNQNGTAELREEGGGGLLITYLRTDNKLDISVTAHWRPIVLFIRGIETNVQHILIADHVACASITEKLLKGQLEQEGGFYYEKTLTELWIRPVAADDGISLTIHL